MALTGTRKAALLLMSLDAGTAANLLKTVGPDKAREIAAELAYINAAGLGAGTELTESIVEFTRVLEQADGGGPGGGGFVQQVLRNALGTDKTREIMAEMDGLVGARDPFLAVRAAEVEDIAEALKGESPQVVAMVLAELPQKKSGQLLGLLDAELQGQAIRGMTIGTEPTAETKLRVASVVQTRLEKQREVVQRSGGRRPKEDDKLRRVALLLRSLNAELRSGMVKAIMAQDPSAARNVKRLMVIWEDLPVVADRSMQEALRELDANQLALALVGAEEVVINKVRSNMSERAAAMLDEESSLLSSPSEDDIDAAREAMLEVLRGLSESGTLNFEEQ